MYEGVTRGLDYQFVVQALNAVGDSDRSDPLAILAAVVPSAPLNLNVTGSGSGSISLEWTAPEKVGGSVLLGYYAYYQLYSALLTAPDVWLKTSLLVASAVTHDLTGLTAGEQYRIRMVAVNVRGESEHSTSVTRYAAAVPSGLAAPSLVAGTRTVNSMTVQWTAPTVPGTDILGYRLYVNNPNSNAVPQTLVYEGAAISTVLQSNVTGL